MNKHGSLLNQINASISITYVRSINHLVRFSVLCWEVVEVNTGMSEKPV